MLSALDLKSEISDLKFESLGKRSHRHKTERVSPQEPREMYRKVSNSGVVPRSKPSAMLFETETDDLSIWSRIPRYGLKAGWRSKSKHSNRQLDRVFPYRQIFESFVFHVRISM